MARGHNKPGVKSHRRGRRRKERSKLPVAPWIVVTTVITLVLSSLTFGYLWLLTSGCSGTTVEAVVLVPERIVDPVSRIAQDWSGTEPQVDGRCVGVSVAAKPSADVAGNLVSNWDTRTNGKKPHVWIAESQAWLQMARTSDRGAAIIPDERPLLVSSPTVIAMPEPMADALGWKEGQEPVDLAPTWQNLITLATEKTWADYGHDEWGEIKLGMSNPRASTADLHALIDLVDADADGQISSTELDDTVRLKSAVDLTAEDTGRLLNELLSADVEDKALGYVSAFPALERDVFDYNNSRNSQVPLEAVYPVGGTTDADYPIAVLENVEWTSDFYQQIGHQFSEFLRSDASQQQLIDKAFRDSRQRVGSDVLNDAAGLTPQIDDPPQQPAEPGSVTNAFSAWQALNEPINLLVVVDNSDAMAYETPQGVRLDIVRNALIDAVDMFGEQAKVGVWGFSSSAWDGDPAHAEFASLAPLDEAHEANVVNGLNSMAPGGGRALYDTAVDAYQHMLDNAEEGATNMVLLISSGGDDSSGRSLQDATDEMLDMIGADREANPATIVAVGYGEEADGESMTELSGATQGQYVPAQWADELKLLLLSALFTSM